MQAMDARASILAHTVDIPAAKTGFWERYVLPLDSDLSCPTWHISPVVDMVAYHFSWVWILVPMTLASMLARDPDQVGPILYLYALVIGFNLTHRHFGLPYAYFDGEVFRTYRRQLTYFPLACIGLLVATPILLNPKVVGPIGAGSVNAIVLFSVAWNLWHVYMQKFGILRLYMAKDPAPAKRKTAPWIDKYFLLCWFPLYFSYLGPSYKDRIFTTGEEVVRYASVIIRFMEKYQAWLVAPSAVVAACGVGVLL